MKLGELRKLAQAFPTASSADSQASQQEYLRQLGLDPNNLYQELEMDSRYVDAHRDVSYSNAHMQLHSHSFFELLYCCNSCGAEYLVGTERYRLQRGDIIFIPPGVSHRPLLPEHMYEPYRRYVLWLSSEFMELFVQFFPYRFSDQKGYVAMLRTSGTKWEHLGDLFRSCVQESEQQADGWEATLVGNAIILLTLIKRIVDEHAAGAMEAEKPELLDRITAYVEEHYTASLSIADLTGRFYVSSSTISHLFKQKMGVSFYRYVTQRRLIAAKNLIAQGLSMEDVSNRSGFSDYSAFYRAFKQEFGISPRQYRSLQDPEDKNAP